VRSTFDLTVEALLPETIYEKVILLRQFSNNPAKTLFDVAEDAGVPAVQEIRDNLPDYVEEKLEGWINGEIEKITVNGVPVTEVAGSIAALAETSLGKFAIDSSLAIDGTSATHKLATLDLAPAGLDAKFSLELLPAATATCASQNGTFTIGTHSFALQYGEYVWRALNARVTADYGADIRGMLGAAVDCPSLANTISQKCYWGYCVGHKPELTEICERGLDEIVDRVHAEFTATVLETVQLDSGTATIANAGNALTDGVWSAQVNVSQGLRNVPATFTATK
jgi:hypothetical protein